MREGLPLDGPVRLSLRTGSDLRYRLRGLESTVRDRRYRFAIRFYENRSSVQGSAVLLYPRTSQNPG